MDRVVVGLFDDFKHAQDVVRELTDAGFERKEISLVKADSKGEFRDYGTGSTKDKGEKVARDAGAGAGAGALLGGAAGLLVGLGLLTIPGVGPVLAAGPLAATLAGAGLGAGAGAVTGGLIGALSNMGVPEEKAQIYAEGVRRGGTLVTVRADGTVADRAVNIMQRHGAVDIDRREKEWRSGGWTGYDTGETHTARTDRDWTDRVDREAARSGETTIPVVEENLNVDKREVERGGKRVTKRVTEEPVEEDVHLRDEHVHVERRPVDREATPEDLNAFRDQTIEVTETTEEPVVRKEARVVEEVTIAKDVEEHTETVRDTLRHSDVDVEDIRGGRGTARGDFNTYDDLWHRDYESRFARSNVAYDQYEPAYRYGYTLAGDTRYSGSDWNTIEPTVRRDWETRYPQSRWDQFKDAVRFAWERARGRA